MPRRIPVLLLALALGVALAGPTLADPAVPLQPPGGSLAPGGETQVEMASETVVIEVLPPPDAGRVRVRAAFTMRNTGGAEERLAVRFPLDDLSAMGNGYYRSYPQVEEFEAAVDARPVRTRTVEEPPRVDEGETVSWAVFDVAFPPGEEVEIAVTYATRLSGYDLARAYYILETGAGWQGPIGSADIVLRLPYEAGPENVHLEEWTSPGGQVAGNEVRWHYEDLEPTREDNWQAYIVWPDGWLHVLELREAVQREPGDVEAWIELAEAYRREGSGKGPVVLSEPLATLSEATAQEAAQRYPASAAAHAELAQVRWWRLNDWDALPQPGSLGDPAVQAVLQEVVAALDLDPDCRPALAVRGEVLTWLGITPTPRPRPTSVASVTPARPTATPLPTATPVPVVAGDSGTAAAPRLAAWPLVVALAIVLSLAPLVGAVAFFVVRPGGEGSGSAQESGNPDAGLDV